MARFPLIAAAVLLSAAAAADAQFFRPPVYNPYRFQNPFLRPVAPVALPNPLSNPAFATQYYLRQSVRPVAGVYPYPAGYPYGSAYLNSAAAAQAAAVQQSQALAGAVADGSPASDTPGFLPDGRALVAGDLHVKVPTADTKLFIDDTALDGTGTDRHLNLPDLPVGPDHKVKLTAKYTKDGKERAAMRTVTLNGKNHGFADFG